MKPLGLFLVLFTLGCSVTGIVLSLKESAQRHQEVETLIRTTQRNIHASNYYCAVARGDWATARKLSPPPY